MCGIDSTAVCMELLSQVTAVTSTSVNKHGSDEANWTAMLIGQLVHWGSCLVYIKKKHLIASNITNEKKKTLMKYCFNVANGKIVSYFKFG